MNANSRLHAVCSTCKDARWLYCSGSKELGCQDTQIQHIHLCPTCGLQEQN